MRRGGFWMNRQPFGAGARWRRRAVTCGITVERLIDDSDREADLGSFDGMIDQTKSLRTTGLKQEKLDGWPVQMARSMMTARKTTLRRKAKLPA
jgi:hypothetical protein